MIRISALLLVMAGCSDPTVSVSVVVASSPRDYAASLETLAISVLATDEFDCDDVAYGELDEDAIALAEVTGVTLLRGQGVSQVPIAGVPRLGAKLWLAEGRRGDGRMVIAGCTEQGDIEDDVEVTIVTEAVASVTVAAHAPDAPVPETLHVQVDDGDDEEPAPLADREVRWEIFGAHGDTLSGAPDETDADGQLDLTLDGPAIFGPASIQVRARWGRELPEVAAAFQMVPTSELSINRACTGSVLDTLAVDTVSWGQFRLDQGTIAIAGLARDATRARLYVASWDGSAAADACSAELGATVATYAVLRGGQTDPVDRLLVVTGSQWIEHEVAKAGDTLAMTPRAPTAWDNPGASAPVAVVTMRSCGRDDGDLDYVLAQLDDDTVIALDPDGQAVTKPFATSLDAALSGLAIGPLRPRIVKSGCISQGQGEPPLQALILGFVRTTEGAGALPRYLAIDDPVNHYTGVIVPSIGAAAFTGVNVDEPFLLGGAIDPTGAKVVRWRLTEEDDGLTLREDARDDSIGPPASIALGFIDGDEALDTVWGLVEPVQGGTAESRLQMSMGCGAGTVALNSVTEEVESPGVAVFLAPSSSTTADLVVGAGRFTVFLDTDLAVVQP